MKTTNAVENEIKLALPVNFQLKMITIENRKEIQEKILLICNLLGIATGAKQDLNIVDDYYDTEDHFLETHKFYLRKRIIHRDRNVKHCITIKSPHPLKKDTIGLARYEREYMHTEAKVD